MIEIKQVPTAREVIRKLDRMREALRDDALRAGFRTVAEPIAADYRGSIPVLSGRTKDSIGWEFVQVPGGVGVHIGATRDPSRTYVLNLLEDGRKGFTVRIKNKRVLSNRRETFGTKATIPPKPGGLYAQKALRRNEGRIERDFVRGVTQILRLV